MPAYLPLRLGALTTALVVLFAISTRAQERPVDQDHQGNEHHEHQTAHKDDHSHHQHPADVKGSRPSVKKRGPSGEREHGHSWPTAHRTSHGTHGDQGSHGGHEAYGGMTGFLGHYPMTREGSGTSWVPETSPHEGIHRQIGDWTMMWHALFNLTYDHQRGARGADKTFVSGMWMGMAQRQVGDGTFGVRAMLSPDAFMGKNGYPLLLQSGETANGVTHLVDRQHPHDLFMELAAIYSRSITTTSSVFLYAGLPGEPALGPPAFMHRTSGMDIPEAPITHHWLDSTHITFGVLTAGVVVDQWKLEASAFRGREPDEYRYDIEAPKLDSVAARLSWNPLREFSLQVSWGRLHSPEQLEPNINEYRVTASAIYTQPFGKDNLWSTTVAWGRKMLRPGNSFNGFLAESAVILDNKYTLFARAESVAETELHQDIAALEGRVFTVGKVSVGGIYDFYRTDHIKAGIGALVSRYVLPGELAPLYGSDPTSTMVFARLKVM
jgi:hypothetical protein